MADGIINEVWKTHHIVKTAELFAEEGMRLGLFTGATVPGPTTVFADLTEVTGSNYSQQVLSGWSGTTDAPDDAQKTTANVVTFSNDGGSDWDEATGWFVFNDNRGDIVMAGLFDVPWTLAPGAIKLFLLSWLINAPA